MGVGQAATGSNAPDGAPPAPGAPLRVLLLIDSLGLGGAEQLVATFAGAAPRHGIDVSVVSLSSASDHRDEMVPALRRLGADPLFLGVRRLSDPGAVGAVARAIRRSGCHLVHAHLEYSAVLGSVAGALSRRPVVTTFHTVPDPSLRGREAVKERLAVAASAVAARRTLFVSQAAADAFATRYPRLRRRWEVVPNGVDLDAVAAGAEPVRTAFGLPADAAVVLLPAALRPGKGHDTALDAWPRIEAAVPSARLVFAGSGSETDRLERRAAALGVADTVVFAGFQGQMGALLRASQLVLLPSRQEALPTVLLEAAAAGRPAVASAVGGIPEVVEAGVTGLLVPPDDPDAVAAAVIGLLLDERRRQDMGRAARDRAERRFGVDVWLSRLRSLYDDVLAGRDV